MGVVNRTLDSSQQKEVIISNKGAAELVNGFTSAIGLVYTPGVVTGGQLGVAGISGSPAYSIKVARFVAGTGLQVHALCSSQVPWAMGTSGVLPSGLSLPASGSTLLNVQQGDLLMLETHGGTGAAANFASVAVVIRPIQDIKQHFGGNA